MAQSIPLKWNPSPSPNVTGYAIYYGFSSGQYTASVDAANSTSFVVTGLMPGETYYVSLVAYDSDGDESPFSNEVTNTIPMPPVISADLVSQEVVAGTTAVFTIGVTSTVSMTLQWFDDGILLAGATNTTLTVPNVSDANAGDYSVVISSLGGSVTSSLATLSVLDPPTIASEPLSQSVGVGANVLFHVAVYGTPPFSFQWFANGTALAVGRKGTLHLSDVSAASAGNYYVVVQNAIGAVTSASAALVITNSFAQALGTYNGLFYQTNGNNPNITEATAGMLGNCTVTSNGVYSATLYIGGYQYPLSGSFNSAGNDTEIISRQVNGVSNLTVTLSLITAASPSMITGSVSNMAASNPWTAPLLADLDTNAPPIPAKPFNMNLPSEPGALNSPTGWGYAYVTMTTNGMVNLAGYTPDWVPFSESVGATATGIIPFYCSLYGGSGLAEGWINLSNGVPSGTVTLVRPAGFLGGDSFPLGFTNVLTVP
jgi:hypothetical protein